MLRVIEKDLVSGKATLFFGEEAEVTARLRRDYPEAQDQFTLSGVLAAINQFGEHEVSVLPYQAANPQLPKDYLTHEESEDPWPREG